jgi:hypothetical protein
MLSPLGQLTGIHAEDNRFMAPTLLKTSRLMKRSTLVSPDFDVTSS